MTAIPKKTAERLIKEVPIFQKILSAARDRDVNESDTVTIVKDIFARVFGFNKYTEVTSEYAIKNTYCDLAVQIDGVLEYLIEVKAIGLTLKDSFLKQAVNYGANKGIEHVILTNGIDWELYSVKCEGKVTHNQICRFNFLELNPRKADDREKFFLLCRKGIGKKAIEEYQDRVEVVNRYIIGAVLRSQPILKVVRRELKRLSPDVKTTTTQILNVITTEIFKREIVEGESADGAAKRVNKSQKKALRKKKAMQANALAE